jgi:hypothetical protein
MPEAALATMSPGVKLTSSRHSCSVETSALNRGDALARKFFNLRWESNGTRSDKTKLTADRITPLVDIPLGCKTDSMCTSTAELDDLCPLQAINHERRCALLRVFAVAKLTIDTLTPGVNLATCREGCSVVLTTRNLGDLAL